MKNIKLLGSAMLVSLALFSQSSLAKEYKIGASLLTQQHPFYIDLANAMKEEAKKDNVNLSVSIANQDLNKQLSDVEDFITKKVDAIIISPVDSKGVQAAIIKADKVVFQLSPLTSLRKAFRSYRTLRPITMREALKQAS